MATDPTSPFDVDEAVLFEFLGIIDPEIGQATSMTPRAFLHPVTFGAVTPIKIPAHPAHRY